MLDLSALEDKRAQADVEARQNLAIASKLNGEGRATGTLPAAIVVNRNEAEAEDLDLILRQVRRLSNFSYWYCIT